VQEGSSDNAATAEVADLSRRGVQALRANDIAAAIELLSQALELDASDSHAQFQLGVALQAAGRHAEAVERFRQAQASLPDDPAPFLHAAVSHLAIGDNQAALAAASEACWRAPKLAATHYAYGQAFAALGEPGRAEQAFAAAIQLNLESAVWIYREGGVGAFSTA
jgi:tetratricopeptide (TPR) repeat protein